MMNKSIKALALSIAFVLTGHGDKIDEINSVQQTAKDLTSNKEIGASKESSIKITLPAYTVIYRALDESTANEKPDAKACPTASPGCLRWIANTISDLHVEWPAKDKKAYAKNILTASIYAGQLFKQAVDASGPANTEQALYDSVLATLANTELKKPEIHKLTIELSRKCSFGFFANTDSGNYSMCLSSAYSDRLIKRNGLAWLGATGWIDGRKIELEEIRSANIEISKLLSYKQGLQDANSQKMQFNKN